MMRWSHGHSLATGALLGLAFVEGHLLWALTAVFVFGVMVGRGWGALARLLRWLGRGSSPLEPAAWRRLRRRVDVLRPDDRIPF